MPFRDLVTCLTDIEGYLQRIKNLIIDVCVLKGVSSIYLTAPNV